MLGFIDLPYMSEEEINGYIDMGGDIAKKCTDCLFNFFGIIYFKVEIIIVIK